MDVVEKKLLVRLLGVGGVLLDFFLDEKEKLNLLLNWYSFMEGGVEVVNNGSVFLECNGSFLKLVWWGVRLKVEFLFIDLELRNEFFCIVVIWDMGIVMILIVLVEVFCIGILIRFIIFEKNLVNNI